MPTHPSIALSSAPITRRPPALTIQQQSDSALMLLRCDWKEAGVVERTLTRLRRALALIAELVSWPWRTGALGHMPARGPTHYRMCPR